MAFDEAQAAQKLRCWEGSLQGFRLPGWEEIPEFGLYMEQVLTLLEKYLHYLPSEGKDEEFITAAAINNYVRLKAMPGPVKKRYYRIHIAYLLILCTLKQSLSLRAVGQLLRVDLTEGEMQERYTSFVRCHRFCTEFFLSQVRATAAPLLGQEADTPYTVTSANDLVVAAALVSGFSRQLAEKLLLLEGKSPTDPSPSQS